MATDLQLTITGKTIISQKIIYNMYIVHVKLIKLFAYFLKFYQLHGLFIDSERSVS